MKKFFKEFKEFISRGNIIDLAVAVVVGGAFGKIVTSLVNYIIMPLISLLAGGVSIEDWKWVIKPADEIAGTAESALHYGIFIQDILYFLIISFFIFLAIRLIQRSKQNIDKLKDGVMTSTKRIGRKTKKSADEQPAESVVTESNATIE